MEGLNKKANQRLIDAKKMEGEEEKKPEETEEGEKPAEETSEEKKEE